MEHPDPIERLTRLTTRPVSRRWRLLLIVVVFVVGGGMLRSALGIEWSTEGVRAMVADAGICGAITGRAIYEGTLDVAEAQRLCDEAT